MENQQDGMTLGELAADIAIVIAHTVNITANALGPRAALKLRRQLSRVARRTSSSEHLVAREMLRVIARHAGRKRRR